MKLSVVIFLTTTFIGQIFAEYLWPVQTQTFAPPDVHEDQGIADDKMWLGFFIAGYAILGVALIVSMILVWKDEIARHKYYN